MLHEKEINLPKIQISKPANLCPQAPTANNKNKTFFCLSFWSQISTINSTTPHSPSVRCYIPLPEDIRGNVACVGITP